MKSTLLLCLLLFLPCLAFAVPAPPVMTYDTDGLNVTISWSEVSGATGYKLYYAPYPYTGPENTSSVDVADQTSKLFYLWEGAAYHITVTAYDVSGESGYSNVEYFIMGPPTPEWVDDDGDGYVEVDGDCDDTDASVNPAGEEICGDDIDQDCSGADLACPVTLVPPVLSLSTSGFDVSVSWTTVEGATGYKLYYALAPYAGPETIYSIDIGNQTSKSFSLWEGASYHIAVTAYDDNGETGYSNIMLFTLVQLAPEDIDEDNDGYTEVEGDCNDAAFSINPGATEICGDNIDQDCNGADEVCHNESFSLNMSIVMGPIIGATVTVSPLDDRATIVATGTTQSHDDLVSAGQVVWDKQQIASEYQGTPLYVRVSGGVDIDANDDGVRDNEPTDYSNIELEFALPNPADLQGFQIVANPLLRYASAYVFHNLEKGNQVNSAEVRTVLRQVAKALIEEDINGDDKIDWEDIVSFNPSREGELKKARVPWEKVLSDLARMHDGYRATLEVTYGHGMDITRDHDLMQLDEDDWHNELHTNFSLSFDSTKDNYSLCDVYDAQGMLGGSVTLPAGAALTYYNNSEMIYDDTTPPTNTQFEPTGEDCSVGVGLLVGGTVTSPSTAPLGLYQIHYSTSDGASHVEDMYVYENQKATPFVVRPIVDLDNEGFVNTVSWRFEDLSGTELKDPAFVKGFQYVNFWGSVDQVNDLTRTPGYYKRVPQMLDDYAFQQSLDLINPSDPVELLNNGHKIHFEDIGSLRAYIFNGDGTGRIFHFTFGGEKFNPRLSEASFVDNQATLTYDSGPNAVDGIKYRFDDDPWTEVPNLTMTTKVPLGSKKLYVAAKDSSGFYYYPPQEFNFPR